MGMTRSLRAPPDSLGEYFGHLDLSGHESLAGQTISGWCDRYIPIGHGELGVKAREVPRRPAFHAAGARVGTIRTIVAVGKFAGI
jgi:hypothetical protein